VESLLLTVWGSGRSCTANRSWRCSCRLPGRRAGNSECSWGTSRPR